MKLILSILLMAVTMLFAQGTESRVDDEAAIRAIVADLANAWTSGDAEAWSEHLAKDIDYTIWTGEYVKGREAVTAGHKQIFSTIYKNTRQKLEASQIRFLGSDVAVVHVEGSVVEKNDAFPEKPQIAPLIILAKRNAQWQVTVFHNVMNLEAARERICTDASRR